MEVIDKTNLIKDDTKHWIRFLYANNAIKIGEETIQTNKGTP